MALLTKIQPRDVLFIDEIHRLNQAVEEIFIRSWRSECQLDPMIGEGPAARSGRIDLPSFDRRGDPRHPADDSVPKALRHSAAPLSLRTGGTGPDSHACGRAARHHGKRGRRAGDRPPRSGNAAPCRAPTALSAQFRGLCETWQVAIRHPQYLAEELRRPSPVLGRQTLFLPQPARRLVYLEDQRRRQ